MLRHGRLIAEASFAPYLKGTWHSQHGIAKSITGLAIGMLCDEGKLSLDTKLTEIFGSRISFLNSLKLKNISVYDLLTMSSGSSFNEGFIHSGNDWAGMFFDAPLNFEPGSRFEYNSMNTYMLSATVTAVTGVPMDEYLRPRLFEPLGITRYIWEKCPKGITKGGWGLWMYPEDVAKIAQLYLNKGIYSNNRLVSAEWISKSFTPRFLPEDEAPYGYGLHVWTGEKEGEILLRGMMLQECFVFPQNDIIIIINAGSGSHVEDRIQNLVNSYFGAVYNPPAFLVDNPASYNALKSLLSSFAKRDIRPVRKRGGWKRKERAAFSEPSFDKMCECLNGHSYVLDNKDTGFLPHFMQYLQNNRSAGLSEISFEKDHRGLVIHMTEGGRTNDLFISHDKDRYSVMNFKGEFYLVSGIGSFAKDEDGDLCLKTEASFVEGECRRSARFFFKDGFNRIKIELTEAPGTDTDEQATGGSGLSDITDTVTGHKKDRYEKIGENVLWARP